MLIQVTIQLQEHDNYDLSPSETADAIFAALGADESLDLCTVHVLQLPGQTGTPVPEPPTAEPLA